MINILEEVMLFVLVRLFSKFSYDSISNIKNVKYSYHGRPQAQKNKLMALKA